MNKRRRDEMPKKKSKKSAGKDVGLKAEFNATKFKRISFLDKVKMNALKDAPMTTIIEAKDPKAYAKKLEAEGVKVLHVYDIIKAVAVEIPANKILAMSKDTDLDLIHEDMIVHTCLDKSVPHIGAPVVWKEMKNKGEGIIVAVVDTGVDPNHPDLKGKVVATEDFTDEGYFDGNGHGTHVAGTIAGNGKASNSKYMGVAPEAKIIGAKVLASNGSGTFSGVIAGIEWAAKQNPHVMNLSLGASIPGSCDGTDPCSMAVNAAMDQGIIVCIAAGNSGPGSNTVGSPGCAKKVITIGASNDVDNIAWFSSRGPTLDGRVKPDIVLPGVDIIAARAKDTAMGTVIDEHHTQASGTSMATPHCAGVAALIKAEFPDINPQDVKQLLMNTAIDLKLDPNTQGQGRVDVEKAITEQASQIGETPKQEPDKQKPSIKSKTPEASQIENVIEIEGIGKEYAADLKRVGIKTTEDLRLASLVEIVEATNISPKLLFKWICMADLFRVRRAAEEYTNLLFEMGIETVGELAKQKAGDLHNRVERFADEAEKKPGWHGDINKVPTEADVEQWIKSAKELVKRK